MALLHSILALAAAQWIVPPPAGHDGFHFGAPDAPAKLEMFIDLLCSSCKAAFPTIEKVAAEYGPGKLQLTVHTFPCPWHTWAYAAAKSMHVVDAANRSAVLPWLRLVFANQDAFFNDGPYSTPAQVDAALEQLAVAGSVLPRGAMRAGLRNSTFDIATRIAWKYTVNRGISGTPGFQLNGVPVLAEDIDGGAWSVAQWKAFIDPVLKPLPAPARRAPAPAATCPVTCAADAGAAAPECCPVGAFCIPGVGCTKAYHNVDSDGEIELV